MARAAPTLGGRPEETEVKTLIFLDVDGVLCCNFQGRLEADKLHELQRVCCATDAKVVLSSDWRRSPPLKDRVISALRDLGVECIGVTPEHSSMMNRAMLVRPVEITTWLASHDHVSQWVAIDDRDLHTEEGGGALQGHFVRTMFATGLTPLLADRCIALLSGAAVSPLEDAPEPLRSLADLSDLLREAGVASDLQPVLECAGEETASLAAIATAFGILGRVEFMSVLRRAGVCGLGERQAITNALGKATRQGRIAIRTRPSPPSLHPDQADTGL